MKTSLKLVLYPLLVLAVALAGCSRSRQTTPLSPTEFVFEVVVDPQGGGTVTPAAGNYRDGWTFAAAATPYAGYQFASWSGDVPAGQSATANPITVVMDRPRTLHANFVVIPTVTLAISTNPQEAGTVTPPGGAFTLGTVLSVLASPAPGFRFLSWSGDVPAGQAKTANPIVIAIDRARTLQADFEPAPRADLIILPNPLAAAPSIVADGGTVTLSSWTVQNQGPTDSGAFSNGFYLSADAVITASDTYLGGNTNGNLAPGGQFFWGGLAATIPKGTAPGNYYVGILVDRENLVRESNEINNFIATPITVTALPPGPTATVYRWTLTATAVPLSDARVRTAICLAIDEQAINASVLSGQNARLEAGLEFASGQNDQSLARRNMWDAGYPNGFRTYLSAAPDDAIIRSIAYAIASQLSNIGINVTLSFYASAGAIPPRDGISLTITP